LFSVFYIAIALRVRIIFRLRNKGAVLPFHHQHILAEMVQRYIEGYRPNGNGACYNFSSMKGQTKVSRHGLHYYSSRVTLVMASRNRELIDHFINNLFGVNLIEVGNLILSPESAEIEQIPPMNEASKYICLSPLIIAVPGSGVEPKEFVMPDTDLFSDLLYDSTMFRMEKSGLYTSEEITSFFRFQILPDKDYIEKINKESKKFARIYTIYQQGKKVEVRGYTMPFALYAHPAVQEFVFINGLGECNEHGYGMLDLANTDPAERSEIYRVNGAKNMQTANSLSQRN
jgi:CRISPR-associated endoribonuclease Cas6